MHYLLFFQICIFLPCLNLLLIICGDIEINPGPEIIAEHNLSICNWNLNGLDTNYFFKISLFEAYNTVHDFDINGISETFMNSAHFNDYAILNLQEYTMIRSDHPSNAKRGGVCIFYKDHLSFVRRTDITYLDECLIGEIKKKKL